MIDFAFLKVYTYKNFELVKRESITNMDLESVKKAEQAKSYFYEGYNCAQAVALAFQEELNIEKEPLVKLCSSFGGGMGRLREVCGAVSGMFMVAGMLYGYADPREKADKSAHYKLIQELADQFKQENGSIVCRDLLGVKRDTYVPDDRTKEYYKKRPCADLVYQCAKLTQELINKKSSSNIIDTL